MRDILQQIERLNAIGVALSVERDIARLMEQILLGAKEITNADGGTLYSVREDGTVKMEIVRTDSLDFAMGGTSGKPIPFPPIPLYDEHGVPNDKMVVTRTVLNGQTINVPDAYDAEEFDFSGTRAFDQKTGYRSTSFLTVPMKNHEGDIIGVLQLLNAQDDDGEVVPFSTEAQRLTESIASQAAIALTNNRLITELKELFEGFIHLVAGAIDQKSPYTGGHCRRVPVLTMMLADAVSEADSGPFRDFRMTDADRYELEIASWLHDCGKITTPEWVVDKATKLETIFDRFELVQTRFEILRRDAEIAMLRRRLEELGGDPDTADDTYRRTADALDDELEFIGTCNLGGEFMTEESQARIHAIAERRWKDRHGESRPALTENEVQNLNIPRGTLMPEERDVINNHIAATINMLESLPLPKHLRRIPEFAGGHHERMDGKGYPKGLKGDQMSVQARMMAIADIFEALTASDRPYKVGKTLSQALGILSSMSRDGHVDPDLFRIFIDRKIYLRYAKEYLDPKQVDAVDTAALQPGA